MREMGGADSCIPGQKTQARLLVNHNRRLSLRSPAIAGLRKLPQTPFSGNYGTPLVSISGLFGNLP
jgi:hypothetical protein